VAKASFIRDSTAMNKTTAAGHRRLFHVLLAKILRMMDKKTLYESLVYADRDFIATVYETISGDAPGTQVTKAEAKGAGANFALFSGNLGVTETRSFKMSTFGMLAYILRTLEEYSALPTPPIGISGRSIIGWISGELSVATVEVRKRSKSHSNIKSARQNSYAEAVDAAQTLFTLRSSGGIKLSLITSQSYFASGLASLVDLSEVVIDQVSIPVRALVKVVDARGSFNDRLAIPLLMLDAEHAVGQCLDKP
jgi:hypothetical protein